MKYPVWRACAGIREPLLESYEWLEAALQSYQTTAVNNEMEYQWLLPILAASSVVGIVVFAFLNFPWLAVVFAGIALVLGFLTYRQFRAIANAVAATPENNRIAAEYERRFGSRCHGLSDLHARKNSLDREFNQLKSYAEQIQIADQRMLALSSQIEIRLTQWLTMGISLPDLTDRWLYRNCTISGHPWMMR